MSQGRKPLPTHLKVVRGTLRPSRSNSNEPKPKADAIRMPSGMSPLAKKHWSAVCKQLKDAKIMTNLDVPALAMYCEAYATWKDATDKITTIGAVVKGPNGYPVRSPYLMVAQKSFEQMRSMLTEFGMTPSSRSRISAPEQKSESTGWDDL